MVKHMIKDPETGEQRHEDNTEFLARLMTSGCPTGMLIQPFVITALQTYAEQCIAAGPETFTSALLHGPAWVATAKFVLKETEKHLE